MKRPKAVIFDCDGVLVDSEILANKVEVEFKNKYGVRITLDEQLGRFVGMGKMDPVMLEELAKLPADYWKIVDEHLEIVYKEQLKAIDGVMEMLTSLRLPKCVGSNSGTEHLKSKLDLTDLSQFFPDAVFSVDHVKKPKPAPDLYLYAAKTMGWKAEDCMVIEDSEHGVRAGKAAGMLVCGFLGGGHVYSGHADKLLKAGADYLVKDIRNILRLTD